MKVPVGQRRRIKEYVYKLLCRNVTDLVHIQSIAGFTEETVDYTVDETIKYLEQHQQLEHIIKVYDWIEGQLNPFLNSKHPYEKPTKKEIYESYVYLYKRLFPLQSPAPQGGKDES